LKTRRSRPSSSASPSVESVAQVVGLRDRLDFVGHLLERSQRGAGEHEAQSQGEEQTADGDERQGAHEVRNSLT
jgi:hypothetical protein